MKLNNEFLMIDALLCALLHLIHIKSIFCMLKTAGTELKCGVGNVPDAIRLGGLIADFIPEMNAN